MCVRSLNYLVFLIQQLAVQFGFFCWLWVMLQPPAEIRRFSFKPLGSAFTDMMDETIERKTVPSILNCTERARPYSGVAHVETALHENNTVIATGTRNPTR